MTLRAAEKRVLRAREALRKISSEERIALHREFGDCNCAAMVKLAVEKPRMAIGAVVGAIFAELLGASSPPTTPQVAGDWEKLLGASK